MNKTLWLLPIFAALLFGCESEQVFIPVQQEQQIVDDDETLPENQPEPFSDRECMGYPGNPNPEPHHLGGEFLEECEGYRWYRYKDYHFAVDEFGQLKESSGLIYDDNECDTPIAEIYDYPLHYSHDIYVFEFEGNMYHYPLGGFYEPISHFYYRVPDGECEFVTSEVMAREIERQSLWLPF